VSGERIRRCRHADQDGQITAGDELPSSFADAIVYATGNFDDAVACAVAARRRHRVRRRRSAAPTC
jgi:hypothetical protein